jgi:hypothetical protein
MSSGRGVATLLVLAATVGWWTGVPAAHAQAPGESRVVEGQLINGTAGGASPSGVTVILHEESLTRHDHRQAVADAEGRFRFDGIALDPDALYGVSVSYQGGLYGSDLDLTEASLPPVDVTVYESTADDSSLAVSGASVLIAQVESASQTMWALEIVKIVNDTDRTYVPGPQPMSLLRFGLPAGARGLQVESSLTGTDVLQVDRGFALTASVPPGEHEVMYAYSFTYSGGEATFNRSFPYGAGGLRVLVPYEVALVTSQDLSGPERVTIGEHSYQLLSASDLPRGFSISFDLLGLPRASFGDRLGQRLDAVPLGYAAPVVLVLLMVTLVGLALWRRSAAGATHAMGTVGSGSLEADRDLVIRQIALLEERFEEGALSEGQYRRRREALNAKLTARSTRRLVRPE